MCLVVATLSALCAAQTVVEVVGYPNQDFYSSGGSVIVFPSIDNAAEWAATQQPRTITFLMWPGFKLSSAPARGLPYSSGGTECVRSTNSTGAPVDTSAALVNIGAPVTLNFTGTAFGTGPGGGVLNIIPKCQPGFSEVGFTHQGSSSIYTSLCTFLAIGGGNINITGLTFTNANCIRTDTNTKNQFDQQIGVNIATAKDAAVILDQCTFFSGPPLLRAASPSGVTQNINATETANRITLTKSTWNPLALRNATQLQNLFPSIAQVYLTYNLLEITRMSVNNTFVPAGIGPYTPANPLLTTLEVAVYSFNASESRTASPYLVTNPIAESLTNMYVDIVPLVNAPRGYVPGTAPPSGGGASGLSETTLIIIVVAVLIVGLILAILLVHACHRHHVHHNSVVPTN